MSGPAGPNDGLATEHASPGLLRVLERLDAPAEIVSAGGVTLAQNELAAALLGERSPPAALDRHVLASDDRSQRLVVYTAEPGSEAAARLASLSPRSQLDEFFDLSVDLLCVAGLDGYFKRVNAAFERTLGYSREELMSRPFMERVHPDDVQKTIDVLQYLAGGNDIIGFETRLICVDGRVRRFEWNTRTMPERGVVYGIGRDVSELRTLADEQAALRHVATVVASESSPEAVFAAVAEEVGRLLNIEIVVMFRYEDNEGVTVLAYHGDRDAYVPLGTRLSLDGNTVAGRVRRTERSTRMDDYQSTASGEVGMRARALGVRCAVGAPIVVAGRVWGAMVAYTRRSDPLPPDAEVRIEEFTALVATAVANAEARTQIAASRARMVAAADDERRKVVRDLHDGAQQRLVHTVLTLKLAAQALARADASAPALVTDALEHAEHATAELRELSHGILPAALTAGGLRAGVESLVARMAVPVDVDVDVDRLPETIEATAYFVVAEALTNVAKHARAKHAAVVARVDESELVVAVRDDGIGGARAHGTGLVGLGDRVAALDGRLTVASPLDGGTLVQATIPII